MEGPDGIMLSEINQRVEDCMISLTYRIQKTKEVRIKRTDWWLPEGKGLGDG